MNKVNSHYAYKGKVFGGKEKIAENSQNSNSYQCSQIYLFDIYLNGHFVCVCVFIHKLLILEPRFIPWG